MGGAAKGIDEQKKNEKSPKAGAVDSIKEPVRNRFLLMEYLIDIQMKKEEGDSQAKKSRRLPYHGESRQEQ